MRMIGLLFVACLMLTTRAAEAELMTLDAYKQGFFSHDGRSSSQLAITGWTNFDSRLLRAFFTFDLSSFAGKIESAALSLKLDLHSGAVGSLATVNLYDFTTLPTLGGQTYPSEDETTRAIYEDLGSGTLYGSSRFAKGVGYVIDIELNAEAIEDLNEAINGHFVIGVTMPNPLMLPHAEDVVRFGTFLPSGNHLKLEYTPLAPPIDPEPGSGVATPEPGTLVIWLLLIMPACVWGLRRRRSLAS